MLQLQSAFGVIALLVIAWAFGENRVMAPVCWLMGLPWRQAVTAGSLMGTKTILSELIAYVDFSKLPPDALDARSRLIMLHAMCASPISAASAS